MGFQFPFCMQFNGRKKFPIPGPSSSFSLGSYIILFFLTTYPFHGFFTNLNKFFLPSYCSSKFSSLVQYCQHAPCADLYLGWKAMIHSIFLTTGWARFLCCCRLILIVNPFPHTSQIHPSARILSESLCAMGHVRQHCQCFTFVFPHLAHKHKLSLPMLTLEMFSQSQDPSWLLPTTWTWRISVQDHYHQCVLQWEVSGVTRVGDTGSEGMSTMAPRVRSLLPSFPRSFPGWCPW